MVEQIYKIEQVNKIRLEYEKENNIEYKLIIRIRFDELFFDTLNLSSIIDKIQNNEIFIPIDDNEKWNTWCNDQIAIWKSKEITQYSNIFSYLNDNANFLYWYTNLTILDKIRLKLIYTPINFIINNICKLLYLNESKSNQIKNYSKLFALLFIQDICKSDKTFYLERIMFFYHKKITQIKIIPTNIKYFLLREKWNNKDIFFF